MFLVPSVAIPLAISLASCTELSKLSSQVQESVGVQNRDAKYPNSAMIYNVCHERWLRNGYANYTFNTEEGRYVASREIQRGKFTQTVVANYQVSQAASCELSYHAKGGGCDQKTRKRSQRGNTIDDFFTKWEKNPGLYQSCHPVLGYPTGYGHTYGSSERRIDATNWLLISSVIPRRSTQIAGHKQGRNNASAGYAEQRIASPSRVKSKAKPEVKIEDYTSVTDLDIKLVSSRVKKSKSHSTLVSKFNVLNKTDAPALLGIKGWILDKNYKRYPLTLEGKPLKKGADSEIVTLKVEPHTQMTVDYVAEGVADIKVSKQTAAMLEIMSVDGVKVNLTLPNK